MRTVDVKGGNMANIYYKGLYAVRQYLEQKYKEEIDIPAVNYECSELVRGTHFRASIYRMPSGNYEVVDYATK